MLDNDPLWSLKQVYHCLDTLMRSVHNSRKSCLTIEMMLGIAFMVAEFD